jgi:hypothetical protein
MITPRIRRNITKRLARRFDMRIVFDAGMDDDAEAACDVENRTVELNPRKLTKHVSMGRFISAILHEVAHQYAYDVGIFSVFHAPKAFESMTIRELKVYIATAWRAERWVEITARHWASELFPGVRYWDAYGRRGRGNDWVRKVYTAEARRVLRRKQLRAIDKRRRNERENG